MLRHKQPVILQELGVYPLDTWNLVVGITLISHTNGPRQAGQIKDLFRWRHAERVPRTQLKVCCFEASY